MIYLDTNVAIARQTRKHRQVDEFPYASVDHHKHEYVVGVVHTNMIQGLLVDPEAGRGWHVPQVQAYVVAEFQLRYNNREPWKYLVRL